MEISKEELIEERLAYAEDALKTQTRQLADLTEYLVRTDPNFAATPGTFDDWSSKLETLRQQEREEKEIFRAKQCLAHHGYLVIQDEGELDMARVKKWVQTGRDPDDEIPF